MSWGIIPRQRNFVHPDVADVELGESGLITWNVPVSWTHSRSLSMPAIGPSALAAEFKRPDSRRIETMSPLARARCRRTTR
jgi:hypothetical protein